MGKNENSKSYDKNRKTLQSKRVLAFIITLLVAQALKSQVMPSLQGKSLSEVFNNDWAISFGGLVLGYLINMFGTSKLINMILLSDPYNQDDYDYTTDDTDKQHGVRKLGGVLIKDILETMVLLGTQVVVVAMAKGQTPEITPAIARNVLLAVFGIILSDVILEPLIAHALKDQEPKWKATASEITKRTLSIASVDYLADLSVDNLVTEAGATAAGIFVGELSSTPAANEIAKQLRPDGTDPKGWEEIKTK